VAVREKGFSLKMRPISSTDRDVQPQRGGRAAVATLRHPKHTVRCSTATTLLHPNCTQIFLWRVQPLTKRSIAASAVGSLYGGRPGPQASQVEDPDCGIVIIVLGILSGIILMRSRGGQKSDLFASGRRF
jgi:hypothetical protein